MKKKFLLNIVAFCLIIPFVTLMVACGKKDKMTNAEIGNVYKTAALNTWSQIGVNNPTGSSSGVSFVSDTTLPDKKVEVAIGDSDNSLQVKLSANTMAGVLYFVGSLYENSNFELNNGVIKFTAEAGIGALTQTYDFTMQPKIDVDNNKLYLKAYIIIGETSVQYINLEANYDFDTNKLGAFRFCSYTSGGIDIWSDIAITDDGKFQIHQTTTSDEFSQALDAEKTEFVNVTKDINQLQVNFSAELGTYLTVVQNVINLLNS